MKNCLTFLVFFLSIIIECYSQNLELDSLKLELQSKKSKEEKYELNTKISKIHFKNSELEEAEKYLYENIKIANQLGSQEKLGTTYQSLVVIFIRKPDEKKLLTYNKKALEIFTKLKDQKGIAKSLLSYSVHYQNKSNYTLQAKYGFESLEISKKIQDTILCEINNRNIAMLYLDQKDYKKALPFAFESLKYARKSGNRLYIAHSLASIAETYNLMNNKSESNKYFKMAYAEYITENDGFGKASVLTNWANLQSGTKEIEMRLKAQEFWDSIDGENIMIMNNLGGLGKAYYYLYNEDKSNKQLLQNAENYLNRSIEMSKKTGNLVNYLDFQQTLSNINAENNNFKDAYLNLLSYKTIHDSIYTQENRNNIAKLEVANTLKLKNKEIELHQKQNMIYILGLLFLSSIGGFLLYQSYTRKKNNLKLQLLNEKLDLANKTKMRFFSIINHDLRSPVSNLIHFLHLQKNNPDLLDEESKQRLENKTIAGAENLLNSMEDLLLWSKGQMENFKPQPKNISVNSIFKDTLNHFSGEEKIQITVDNQIDFTINTDENYLKTIIRNLTGNAIKALKEIENPTIKWKAWQENGKFYLSISDNGKGADSEQFKALYDDKEVVGIKSGLGLHLIRDLARAIHCEITVDSKLGEGTTFTLKL
ncbi:ATP-binding protein [Flavobacterium sp.]|uniref:ATP-binding protein n=1 Tax=Flavobacterium sp. TaxID=239 RepID=UPI003529C7D7